MKYCLKLIAAIFLLVSTGCCGDPCTWEWPCCPAPGASTGKAPEVTRNPQWNHRTIVKLRVGMPLPEFESIFGPPDRGSAATLESKAVAASRTMVYEYDMGKHLDAMYPEVFCVNKVYFTLESDPPTVMRWDVDYVY